jgi:hypothetical protein
MRREKNKKPILLPIQRYIAFSPTCAPSVLEMPHVLQAYLSYGHELLARTNPRLVAELLLLSFPLCTLLNNIAEYRAEHAKASAPSMPPGNAPVLTFPEVR